MWDQTKKIHCDTKKNLIMSSSKRMLADRQWWLEDILLENDGGQRMVGVGGRWLLEDNSGRRAGLASWRLLEEVVNEWVEWIELMMSQTLFEQPSQNLPN